MFCTKIELKKHKKVVCCDIRSNIEMNKNKKENNMDNKYFVRYFVLSIDPFYNCIKCH